MRRREYPQRRVYVGRDRQGADDGTGIGLVGKAPYLDGDIWLAAETPRGQRVVSRFLDLADRRDLHETREALRDDGRGLLPGCSVISQYDAVNPLFQRRIPPAG